MITTISFAHFLEDHLFQLFIRSHESFLCFTIFFSKDITSASLSSELLILFAILRSFIEATINLKVGKVFLSLFLKNYLSFFNFFRGHNVANILITIILENKNFLDDFETISYLAQNHVYKFLL